MTELDKAGQTRGQLLTCLEDVKVDLEELHQHSSAVVVGQAIELIELQQRQLDRIHEIAASRHEHNEAGWGKCSISACCDILRVIESTGDSDK